MACYHLLDAYRTLSGSVSIGRPPHSGAAFLCLKVPCGQCYGCRLERSRQWAIRCMNEASLYEANCMVTLTYDDDHMPPNGSLDRAAFPLFMRRLRKAVGKVRYYHAGEYGDTFGRPHYHGLLFGFDFSDKVQVAVRGGFPVWTSDLLSDVWGRGICEVGSLTFESAAYVARYVMKKVTGRNASEHYTRVEESTGEVSVVEREYATMSRRPGIGKAWLDKYMSETYPEDSLVMRGKLMRPPRYYDLQHELVNEAEALEVARARRLKRRTKDQTVERLAVREECAIAQGSLQKRGLE